MKRWLVRICTFLVLGAIVNVTVAWLVSDDPSTSGGKVRVAASGPWLVLRVDRLQTARISLSYNPLENTTHPPENARFDDVMQSWAKEFLHVAERAHESGDVAFCFATASGFPFVSFWGAEIVATRANARYWAIQTERDRSATRRLLPLRPLWPGFAFNTVFYAFVLWLLFAAPFALRRRRRIRRGLCPKCAYDLRNRPSDSPACPECGDSLHYASRQVTV